METFGFALQAQFEVAVVAVVQLGVAVHLAAEFDLEAVPVVDLLLQDMIVVAVELVVVVHLAAEFDLEVASVVGLLAEFDLEVASVVGLLAAVKQMACFRILAYLSQAKLEHSGSMDLDHGSD